MNHIANMTNESYYVSLEKLKGCFLPLCGEFGSYLKQSTPGAYTHGYCLPTHTWDEMYDSVITSTH